ncbi:MAG: transglutaminase family protein [Hyphomonadaceae bacterium]|nr:transglutaminase family protein [Hyphomonadaceae bacterium]
MNRRTMIAGVAAALAAAPASADAPEAFLSPTRHINSGHRAICAVVADCCAGARTDADKARALFAFVRDEILFGFGPGFWDQKATDVLAQRRGYCNTKSTLFAALLRAAGVPARQVFVDIHVSVLHGIVDPGTPYVDHSYVEVFLNGAWRPTDAYIADPALFAAAQKRLAAEGRLMGYGVHATGANTWDGETPSFAQYNILDPRPIGARTHGVYADVGDFYARAEGVHNRLNPPLRAAFGVLAAGANRNAARVRAA